MSGVACEAIAPGDVLVFLGVPHVVAAIEPYEHPTMPGAFGIARADDGWGVTLWHGQSWPTTGCIRAVTAEVAS